MIGEVLTAPQFLLYVALITAVVVIMTAVGCWVIDMYRRSRLKRRY
jgi:hypothetical protein